MEVLPTTREGEGGVQRGERGEGVQGGVAMKSSSSSSSSLSEEREVAGEVRESVCFCRRLCLSL